MFIYLFLERGDGRKKEREWNIVVGNISWLSLKCVPTRGDQTWNPGMCPVWELNPQPFGLQGDAPPPEPHRPGPEHFLIDLPHTQQETYMTRPTCNRGRLPRPGTNSHSESLRPGAYQHSSPRLGHASWNEKTKISFSLAWVSDVSFALLHVEYCG